MGFFQIVFLKSCIVVVFIFNTRVVRAPFIVQEPSGMRTRVDEAYPTSLMRSTIEAWAGTYIYTGERGGSRQISATRANAFGKQTPTLNKTDTRCVFALALVRETPPWRRAAP